MMSLNQSKGNGMITRIEMKNFQSHKNTIIDFNKGVNVICGETDNGKSSIVRAIRWVAENFPNGTDKINSRWNKDFKEPLSVRLFTEDGWVERIRTKTRNGYTICISGNSPVELSAVGRGVPQEVVDFLNCSDVNFQFQLDPPYLFSKTAGDASKYLNEIVHLDSIDTIMSLADTDKRSLNSEQKTVDSDIKQFTEQLEKLSWVDEADMLYQRTRKLDDMYVEINNRCDEIQNSIDGYRNLSSGIIDLTEARELIDEIDGISLPDCQELEDSIVLYGQLKESIVDMAEAEKIVSKIDSIIITDTDELEEMIKQYKTLSDMEKRLSEEMQELKNSLPDVCPYCGAKIDKEVMNVC